MVTTRTTTVGVHLVPRPARLLMSSKVLSRTKSLRPWRGLKMTSTTRCAAAATGPPWEPTPEEDEDPIDAHRRRHRELRASLGPYSQDDKVAELEDTLFRDERDKVKSHMRHIASNRCILYKNGREMALKVCIRVQTAMRLSAMITANAHLRVDGSSSEISFHTVEQIIRTYVSTLLKFLEDTWHGKVDQQADFETRILSILGALSGLAAVSHIMFEDALAAANATTEEPSSHYSPEYDVEVLNDGVQSRMKELERDLMAASKGSEDKAYELLPRTLTDATDHVMVFVNVMIRLRAKAVAHAQGT